MTLEVLGSGESFRAPVTRKVEMFDDQVIFELGRFPKFEVADETGFQQPVAAGVR